MRIGLRFIGGLMLRSCRSIDIVIVSVLLVVARAYFLGYLCFYSWWWSSQYFSFCC